jgi:hypothetical protein
MNSVLTVKEVILPNKPANPIFLRTENNWKQYLLPPVPHIVGSIPCPYCKEDFSFPADVRAEQDRGGIKEIVTCQECKTLTFVMSRLWVYKMRGHLEWAYVQPAHTMCLFTKDRGDVGATMEKVLFELPFTEWKMSSELPKKYYETEWL